MTLPFIGFRLVWGVVSFLLVQDGIDHLWDVKVVAGSMPEIVATVMFVIGGIRTRNMYASRRREIPSKA